VGVRPGVGAKFEAKSMAFQSGSEFMMEARAMSMSSVVLSVSAFSVCSAWRKVELVLVGSTFAEFAELIDAAMEKAVG
jgi:hypothetical protein